MDRHQVLKRTGQTDHERSEMQRTKTQIITLYDAVAGRVGYEGFLTEQQSSRYRDTASTSHVAVPPEEILFRRKGAPVRFAEDDVYEADRHLEPHHRLPDSDLLKTIHAYAADYYNHTSKTPGNVDIRSLDETALLAVGILLEEASAHALGTTGDLAFVESSEAVVGEDPGDVLWRNWRPWTSVVARGKARSDTQLEGTDRPAATLGLRRQ